MAWHDLTLVSDADLGALEPEATNSDEPWGASTWPAARAEAKRDLQILLEADYPDVDGIVDCVTDQWPAAAAYGLTGGSYTDVLSELANDTEEDCDLAIVFTTVANDHLYLGAASTFEGVAVQFLDSLNANTSALSAKYWGPTGWTALTINDGTAVSGKTCAKSGRVRWAIPTDWAVRILEDSTRLYWVELTVSAALTAGTSATQILLIRPPVGLQRIATHLALAHICRGLSLQATEPDRWIARAELYDQKALDLYTRMRERGSLPLDLDRTGAKEASEPTARRSIVLGRA